MIRQQLEARNKAGKKNEKKHGENFWPILTCVKTKWWKPNVINLLRWSLLLRFTRTDPQLCQVEGAEGEGGEIRSDWRAAGQGGPSDGLARASERIPWERWAPPRFYHRADFLLPGMNLQAPPNHPDPIYAGFRSRPQDRGPPRGQHHRGGKLDPFHHPCVTCACVGIYAYMHPGMPMGSGNGPATTEWEDYWGQGRP